MTLTTVAKFSAYYMMFMLLAGAVAAVVPGTGTDTMPVMTASLN